MTDTVGQTVVLAPSPRHMRKRRLLGDISASQLPTARTIQKSIPEAPRADALQGPAADSDRPSAPSNARPIVRSSPFKKASLKQKRLIALAAVILVSVSIPLLVLTLMFAG